MNRVFQRVTASLGLKPLAIALSLILTSQTPVLAKESSADYQALVERLNRQDEAMRRLEAEVLALRAAAASVPATQNEGVSPGSDLASQTAASPAPVRAATPATQTSEPSRDSSPSQTIGINPAYGFAVLDHAEGINQRQIMQLEARRDGDLRDMVTLSGSVTLLANAQFSNRPNKFGYLMRHPTANNQRTKATQDLTIASAQLAATFTPADAITGYIELLYDPEQSFGSGTLTALARNQVQVRKAYALIGDLQKSPLYAAVGKMDVPFGLMDTVSPYTNSTNWHAFAPLAYGGQVGYHTDTISLRAMAVMGGAQFRGANTPVDGTAIPAKLNNFAVDASYRANFGENRSLRVGGSYLHGSAYCQAYPIFHFNPCPDNVPAWAAYGELDFDDLRLIADFARTTRVWPGTQVPNPTNPLSRFEASRVTSFTFGGRYRLPVSSKATHASVEYSKFISGPEGAPWQRQDQLVFGLAHQIAPSVSLGAEYVRINGFAPLNFLSGGNFPDGSTWSELDARSDVLLMALQAAF